MDATPTLDTTCQPSCPVARTAQIIEGKWTTLVVRELLGGTKRFGELQRALDGISPKMLTERLKLLEQLGLLAKVTHPCVPPKTEYTLTDLGQDLRRVIAAMAEFGLRLPDRPVPGDRDA